MGGGGSRAIPENGNCTDLYMYKQIALTLVWIANR